MRRTYRLHVTQMIARQGTAIRIVGTIGREQMVRLAGMRCRILPTDFESKRTVVLATEIFRDVDVIPTTRSILIQFVELAGSGDLSVPRSVIRETFGALDALRLVLHGTAMLIDRALTEYGSRGWRDYESMAFQFEDAGGRIASVAIKIAIRNAQTRSNSREW